MRWLHARGRRDGGRWPSGDCRQCSGAGRLRRVSGRREPQQQQPAGAALLTVSYARLAPLLRVAPPAAGSAAGGWHGACRVTCWRGCTACWSACRRGAATRAGCWSCGWPHIRASHIGCRMCETRTAVRWETPARLQMSLCGSLCETGLNLRYHVHCSFHSVILVVPCVGWATAGKVSPSRCWLH